jgi:2-polyprenyl-3-methyl-5-hydroxy-6-metoxy-1,4-benzoquinol methylase
MTEFSKNKTSLGYIEAIPRPTQEALNSFYQEQYYSAGVSATYQTQYSDNEIKQKQLRAATCVEAISQNLSRQDGSVSFLEIGSGEGFLLADAMRRGWSCRGVDFQKTPVEKFNPAALPSFTAANPGDVLADLIARKQKFTAVALQNVLEHALHPDTMLQNIRNVIEPDGVFLVQVPNDYSRIQEIATAKSYIDHEYWFLPPQHLNYFNTKTLDAFVSNNGFKIVDAFADFPIEFYLWGGQSNYTRDKKLGPFAHKGRVELDLIMAEAGLKEYLDFYRSLYRVGMGRNISVLLQPV